MDYLSDLGFGLSWMIGMAALAVVQLALHRRSKAAQECRLSRLVQLVEARLRRAAEVDRTQLEARFQKLAIEQKELFEQFRGELVEKELSLRSRADLSVPPGLGTRLERRHRVLALARMGMDSWDISRKLRLSRGETELLLGMREDLPATGAERV